MSTCKLCLSFIMNCALTSTYQLKIWILLPNYTTRDILSALNLSPSNFKKCFLFLVTEFMTKSMFAPSKLSLDVILMGMFEIELLNDFQFHKKFCLNYHVITIM